MRSSIALFILVAIMSSLAGIAQADDWIAVRLRGQVQQLVNEQWQPLKRGDVVPDSRVVRTAANGHVTFQRGNETVAMSDSTQIRIFDRPAGKGGKPFTTIEQEFGTVVVEAEVRKVQHFAVETPYVAAVVKGTKFTVVQGKNSASVSVQRGHVFVEDQRTGDQVTIGVGQSATISARKRATMQVTGRGALPVVTDQQGHVVSPPATPGQTPAGTSSEKVGTPDNNKGTGGGHKGRGRGDDDDQGGDRHGNRNGRGHDHHDYDRGNGNSGNGYGGGGGGGGGRGRGSR